MSHPKSLLSRWFSFSQAGICDRVCFDFLWCSFFESKTEKRWADRLWRPIPFEKLRKIFRRAPLWKPIANQLLAMQVACKMCFTKNTTFLNNLNMTLITRPFEWQSIQVSIKKTPNPHKSPPTFPVITPEKKKHHSMYSPKANGWKRKMPCWKKEPHLKFEMK